MVPVGLEPPEETADEDGAEREGDRRSERQPPGDLVPAEDLSAVERADRDQIERGEEAVDVGEERDRGSDRDPRGPSGDRDERRKESEEV